MLWGQEWHVWVGIALSTAGLGVGIAALIQAAGAKQTAARVESDLDDVRAEVIAQVSKEQTLRDTPPAVSEPASLSAAYSEDRLKLLKNSGTGTAYNVRIEPANIFTTIHGTDRWSSIGPGEWVEIWLASTTTSAKPTIHAYWTENAGNLEHHREIEFTHYVPRGR